jgi:protease I
MKQVAVLVEDHYQVLEVWYPYLRLREAGIKTVLVGTSKKEFRSKEGYPASAELSITHAEPRDFDGVIIPGGYAPDILRRYPKVNAFVRAMCTRRKLVAAICHGGWVLVSAGVLKCRRVTGFHAIRDDLVNAGAAFVDAPVVVDGNMVTSRNPYDLPVFCQSILHFFKGEAHENRRKRL